MHTFVDWLMYAQFQVSRERLGLGLFYEPEYTPIWLGSFKCKTKSCSQPSKQKQA